MQPGPSVSFPMGGGQVELICGPMFSGKTEELIRRMRRVQFAKIKTQIFKPALDDRYDEHSVVSHSSQVIESELIDSSIDILIRIKDATRVVGIDEVQFLDDGIVKVVNKLAARGIRVVCAGLDLDYLGNPFGPMPQLLAVADHVMKVSAICTICGQPATRSQRLGASDKQLEVGAQELYQARCRAHFEVDDSEAEKQVVLPLEELHRASLKSESKAMRES